MSEWTPGLGDVLRDAIRSSTQPDPFAPLVAAFERAHASRAARTPRRRTRVEALTLLSAAARPRPTTRPRAVADGSRTRLDLVDEIGFWGISAQAFVDELLSIDTSVVELHISSPGGDVFDSLVMFNALADHPARVEVVVEGVAASAASFIAMAGDTVKMNRGSQLMLHDAATLTAGNQDDHLRTAELLGRMSDVIASIYAGRAGGDVEHWRDLMRVNGAAGTWFSGPEAVEAGLADESVEDVPASAAEQVAAAFDAGAFRAAVRGAVR